MNKDTDMEVITSPASAALDTAQNEPRLSHELPDTSTRTLVVERRRRLLVAHPNSRSESASSSSVPNSESTSGMSLSMISVKDVRLVKISEPHSCHRCGDHPPGSHASAERNASQRNDIRTGFQVRGMKGRYFNNSPNQRNYHYLPNGPARRSRYDAPGAHRHEEHKSGQVPTSSTSFTLHRAPSSSSSSASSSGTESTDSSYSSASEGWRPPVSIPSHLRSGCSENPYCQPHSTRPSPTIQIPTGTKPQAEASSAPTFSKPQIASSYSRFDCHMSDLESESGDSDTQSDIDVKEEPMDIDLSTFPLASSKVDGVLSPTGSPSSPTTPLSPESPSLGSRERELRDLQQFWRTLMPASALS
ncbi:hypothetical protein PQX77_004719 [Marasmius sp. AFHP31]|nr:hypothetical protein PQX77_004719 [Marasmius sp. AFHP31]